MEALSTVLKFISSPAVTVGVILLFIGLAVYTVYRMRWTYSRLEEAKARKVEADRKVKEFNEKYEGFAEKTLSRFGNVKKEGK